MLTLEQKSGAILWTIAGFAPGVMSFGLPKIAVVALLTRIMNPSRWHALFLWCLSIFCLVNLLGCVIILFAQCQPSHSQWDFSVEKTCWDKWILVYFAIYSGGMAARTRANRDVCFLIRSRVLRFCRHLPCCIPCLGACTVADAHEEESSVEHCARHRISVRYLHRLASDGTLDG